MNNAQLESCALQARRDIVAAECSGCGIAIHELMAWENSAGLELYFAAQTWYLSSFEKRTGRLIVDVPPAIVLSANITRVILSNAKDLVMPRVVASSGKAFLSYGSKWCLRRMRRGCEGRCNRRTSGKCRSRVHIIVASVGKKSEQK